MKEPHSIGPGRIIRRKKDGSLEYLRDDLTIEEPLEIRIGRKTLATTMRTPGNDDELAAEGRADDAGGQVKEGFGKARRKVGEAIEDVGDAIKR